MITPYVYRLNHPRCKYCKYKKFRHIQEHAWYECLVKEKYIPELDYLDKWRGMFCRVYNPKEIDFDI